MLSASIAWNWQPALYLFFGGLGGGMFIVAAFLFYRFNDSFKRAINITAWIATIALGVGLLLLVLELTQPLRGLMLWQSFSNFSSWMAIGAWIVFAAVIVFGLASVLTTEALTKRIAFLERLHAPLCKILFGLGALLGLSVAIYTGILLLSAPGIPLWNTWILPCLFTVSALDTGIAAVEIILLMQFKKKVKAKVLAKGADTVAEEDAVAADETDKSMQADAAAEEDAVVEADKSTQADAAAADKTDKSTQADAVAADEAEHAHHVHKVNVILEISVVVLVVLELVILTYYLLSMLGGGGSVSSTATYATDFAAYTSAFKLLFGSLAILFWGIVVVIGLIMPLLGALSGLIFKDKFKSLNVLIGAICALIGGCTLRFLILYAGVHADYLTDAAYWLVW